MNKKIIEKVFFDKVKVLKTFFIFSIIFCFLVVSNGQQALAQTPGLVPVTGPELTISAANSTILTQKKTVLDRLATMAAKILIQKMTSSIVRWINSGFQGNPGFVTDPQRFLTNVGDQIAGNFLENELDILCTPFADQIKISLATNYASTYRYTNYCRLSTILGTSGGYDKFTSGDFSQGGWNSWFEITQNPQNNPMGAYLAAQSELSIRIGNAQSIKLKELDWGGGFLSYRDCIKKDGNDKCTEYGPIKTPGSVIESQLETTLGTGIRQLELVDDINEVVNALVGQLIQTVLSGGQNGGLSTFGPSGTNFNSLNSSVNTARIPLTLSCWPSASQVRVGESVTWSASVYGGPDGNALYEWSGDVNSTDESQANVTVTYSSPGVMNAAVRVTKGTNDLSDSIFRNCYSGVTVQ